MAKTYTVQVITTVFLFVCCGTVAADVIVAPQSAVAQLPMGENSSSFVVENLINQSGLSTGYTSGVTDFDSYIGTSPFHSSATAGNNWASTANDPTGNIDFDLGSIWTIDELALWNVGLGTGQHMEGFNLIGDGDND